MKSVYLYFLLFSTAILYGAIGYYTSRQDFPFLFGQITLLFCLLALFWNRVKQDEVTDKNLKLIQYSGVGLRVILLFSIPNLSDDFYRFLWDGMLTVNGLNPFSQIPSEVIEIQDFGSFSQMLFDKMNSPNYYSVYPIFDQKIFALSAFIFPENLVGEIIVLKIILLIAELVTIFTLPRLLNQLNINPINSLLYILNPLVIIEGLGNLHFEVITVCFLTLSLFYLLKRRHSISAVLFGLGISVKLIPFMLIPAVGKFLGRRYLLRFILISCSLFGFLSLTRLDVYSISNILKSIDLYFQNFEFNASLYYLFRWIGYQFEGYNIIAKLGPAMAVTCALLILLLSLKVHKNNVKLLMRVSYFSFLLFYLFSTTVHPWYIINILLFGILASFNYSALTWSFMAFLSYAAYSNNPFQENLYLVALEYMLMFSVLIFELYSTFRNINQDSKVKL